jgi:ABC-type transporter lipoprotein component MlaA
LAAERAVKAFILLVLLAALLDGCASQVLSIRTVPDQTPAADNAAAATNAAAFADAVAAESANSSAEAQNAPPPLTPADAPPMYTYDPWERLNRFTYRFNARFDEAIFLPVADTYRRAPRPIRAGIHNFFGNLAEIDSVINYTLQWRLKYGWRSL